MRTKFLVLAIALCGMFGTMMAQEPAEVDTTTMGVHPFKATANMAKPTAAFSLVFNGGVSVFNGDFPMGRFMNLGYGGGLALEYNFSPVWGLGAGYHFDMPQIKTTKDEAFVTLDGTGVLAKGKPVYKSMMHSLQAYVTFNMVNAWFPKAVSDIFALNVWSGIGVTMYKNQVQFRDAETGGDSQQYQEDDLTDPNVHGSKLETVAYIPFGISTEFNVSRELALGLRMQYDIFMSDYVDNRYRKNSVNKRNDGMYNAELVLRWKINATEKNHVKNVSSYEVLETKYYESHPEEMHIYEHRIDTVVVYHKDTLVIIHRDTVVMTDKREQVTSLSTVSSTPAVKEEQPKLAPGEIMILPEERHEELKLQDDWEPKAQPTVVEGQSLSQLARKYYRNTFCWVYIWLANKNVAPDPNVILPSVKLQIPVLNDQQKAITKEEARAVAARARGEQ